MIDEAKVFEKHGVWGNYWVTVAEVSDGKVEIALSGQTATMLPDCALRLASQLRRVARRVKGRTGE